MLYGYVVPSARKALSTRFNADIKNARCEKKKAERKWWRSGKHDILSYKPIKNMKNRLMNEARSQYYRDNSSNQKKLFAAANTLLDQRKKNTVLPPCDDKLALAERMGSYFA